MLPSPGTTVLSRRRKRSARSESAGPAHRVRRRRRARPPVAQRPAPMVFARTTFTSALSGRPRRRQAPSAMPVVLCPPWVRRSTPGSFGLARAGRRVRAAAGVLGSLRPINPSCSLHSSGSAGPPPAAAARVCSLGPRGPFARASGGRASARAPLQGPNDCPRIWGGRGACSSAAIGRHHLAVTRASAACSACHWSALSDSSRPTLAGVVPMASLLERTRLAPREIDGRAGPEAHAQREPGHGPRVGAPRRCRRDAPPNRPMHARRAPVAEGARTACTAAASISAMRRHPRPHCVHRASDKSPGGARAPTHLKSAC